MFYSIVGVAKCIILKIPYPDFNEYNFQVPDLCPVTPGDITEEIMTMVLQIFRQLRALDQRMDTDPDLVSSLKIVKFSIFRCHALHGDARYV